MADEATTENTTAAETSDDDSAAATATEATESATVAEGEKSLGDAGKKALDVMKAERNAAREEAKTLRQEFEALRAQGDGREAEHQAAQEAQRIKDEALNAANARILKAEIRAAAAAKLADPQDALRFLDTSEFEVGADGEVDSSQIAQAIDDLIASKPYLAAQGGQRFQGSADAGARKESRPAQLTQADLGRMSPDQIETARKGGRLDDLLGIKH